jgi:tRNA1Val (adenine37-N6)-methyltransferase
LIFIWMIMQMKKSDERLFQFKQFSLSDSKCAMKIGTDGVLLGGFASGFKAERVLDIGTGCGLLALMIAQKIDAKIDAVEIDKNAAEQARENFNNSPWHNRLKVYHTSIQDYTNICENQYDLIACNPPFFQNSLQSMNDQRTVARHNQSLNYAELFKCASKLISLWGKMTIIIPAEQYDEIREDTTRSGLNISEIVYVKPNPSLLPKRLIIVLTKAIINIPVEKTITIENGIRHQFTNEYKEIMKDFHPFL